MMAVFAVDGRAYEERKDEFKKVLKSMKLKWSGTRFKGSWTDGRSTVTPAWNMDGGQKGSGTVTVESGDAAAFDRLCLAVRDGLGGSPADRAVSADDAARRRLDSEMEFYARITKPDVEQMRRSGCPERWIELSVEDWERKVVAERARRAAA